jgi:Glycosyl hydrolases family 31
VVNYKEGQRFLDFSRAEVRRWWWQHAPLLALGIDGWGLDGGEGPPAATQLHAGSGAALHNSFDLLRQQAFHDGERADRPDRRPFLLCRSGGPGMQRFGAMPWSGDINTTIESFETQIRTGLNLQCPAYRIGAPISAVSMVWPPTTASSTSVGCNSERFARCFVRTTMSGGGTCHGRTVPRRKRSAAATSSCATG